MNRFRIVLFSSVVCLWGCSESSHDLPKDSLLVLCAKPDAPYVHVNTLLDHGFSVGDVTSEGYTPLHLVAAVNSDPDVIRLLVSAGSDVEAEQMQGATPLHLAAMHNPSPDVTRALLDSGASVDVRQYQGVTPLHIAARSNRNP